MKILRQGLGLALLGAGLAVLPTLPVAASSQPAAAPDRSLVQQMRREADGGVRVSNATATGRVGFIRARGGASDLFPDFSGDTTATAARKAAAYLDRFGAAFGADRGRLEQTSVTQDRYGRTVSFVQKYRGVEVFGSMLRAHFDLAGDLTAVNGYAAPGLDLSVKPRLSAAAAGEKAVRMVHADPALAEDGTPVDTSGIEAAETDLAVYRLGATRGQPGEAVLAYVVEVTNERNVRDMVFVDANTGKVVNRYSRMTHALDRVLIEANGSTNPNEFQVVWREDDPLPDSLNPAQLDLVNGTGETYWLFRNAFGRDSYDGAGAQMVTVNNDGRIACPNAGWTGATTSYCTGVTSDDTVAHEWAHAYTEYTSALVYQYQAGALNESFSDVWGETVDILNERYNETPDTPRTEGACSAFSRGVPVVAITAPASIARTCPAGSTTFGPAITDEGLPGSVAVATDAGDQAGPSSTDGCTAITNPTAVTGKVALIDRGTCPVVIKIKNAQAAGAIAVIIGNTDNSTPTFAGEDPTVTIPTAVIGLDNRNAIVSTLAGGQVVQVDIRNRDVDRDSSYRWLSGEGDPAFGGAVRDMWTPTCYGDPGKVSDAEYACDPNLEDAGGVHQNSGIPNHAFALLVDGGTFNGVTVAQIGLHKAAAIWWRTQTDYLTPVSGFVAAADGLEASCADLVGQPINELTLAPEATPVPADAITTDDCAAVTAALAAVEMRQEPVQCNFQPLLAKNPPSVCGPGFSTRVVWRERFEDGLAGWAKQQKLAAINLGEGGIYEGGFGAPWVAGGSAPGNHPGGVAFGPAPQEGQCSGDGETDFSSRDSIISPTVKLPVGAKAPRLTFHHYVATERGFDGGNVKVRINGGRFKVVPATAYLFNAPGRLATLAEANTNPIRGEDAFTGTDRGVFTGSWGQSQVDLRKVGAGARDRVRLRFDIGRDGCTGVDGWYVDNITISSCENAAVTSSQTSAKAPKRVRFGKDFKVRVTVDRTGGGAATSKVKLTEGQLRLGTAGVRRNGVAVIEVERNLAVGRHQLVATYPGDRRTRPSKDRITVRVIR
jgi:Zn-dependent metalloprotease